MWKNVSFCCCKHGRSRSLPSAVKTAILKSYRPLIAIFDYLSTGLSGSDDYSMQEQEFLDFANLSGFLDGPEAEVKTFSTRDLNMTFIIVRCPEVREHPLTLLARCAHSLMRRNKRGQRKTS